MRKLTIAALLMMASLTPSYSQHQSHDLDAHIRFYQSWKQPDHPRTSCCNEEDCFATSFVQKADGSYWALRPDRVGLEADAWVLVPDEKFEHNISPETHGREPRVSPDGRNHVCMHAPRENNDEYGYTSGDTNGPWVVLCAVLGTSS